MYTSEALLDLHERGQRSLRKLLLHCSVLTDEELHRHLPGFGLPSVQQQLIHMVSAEKYWLSVVRGEYVGHASVDEALAATDSEDAAELLAYPDIAALEAFRQEVSARTAEYLRGADSSELNDAREMLCWPGKLRALRPAHVIGRVVTHLFHHQGQVLAMCRSMGKPNEEYSLDFPVDP